MITRYGADIPKEVLDNTPTFDGKPGELNQFLSTIESYSTMYRIHKTDLVMMRARGKVHEIIHHTLQEDTDIEWSAIKRKLTSNYGSTQCGIETSVKISKLSMNSEETVGEYLARAKTLVKSELKDATAWHHDIDEADAYHVCNRIIKTGLKSRMLRRLSQFKSYKDPFYNIEEEWDRSYFMENDFASKEDNPNTATEVDKINTWSETTTDRSRRSRNASRSKQSISQIRQVPISLWVLEYRTKVTKHQGIIQGRSRLPQAIHTKIQQPQTSEHYGSKSSLHIQWYHTKRQLELRTRNI